MMELMSLPVLLTLVQALPRNDVRVVPHCDYKECAEIAEIVSTPTLIDYDDYETICRFNKRVFDCIVAQPLDCIAPDVRSWYNNSTLFDNCEDPESHYAHYHSWVQTILPEFGVASCVRTFMSSTVETARLVHSENPRVDPFDMMTGNIPARFHRKLCSDIHQYNRCLRDLQVNVGCDQSLLPVFDQLNSLGVVIMRCNPLTGETFTDAPETGEKRNGGPISTNQIARPNSLLTNRAARPYTPRTSSSMIVLIGLTLATRIF